MLDSNVCQIHTSYNNQCGYVHWSHNTSLWLGWEDIYSDMIWTSCPKKWAYFHISTLNVPVSIINSSKDQPPPGSRNECPDPPSAKYTDWQHLNRWFSGASSRLQSRPEVVLEWPQTVAEECNTIEHRYGVACVEVVAWLLPATTDM